MQLFVLGNDTVTEGILYGNVIAGYVGSVTWKYALWLFYLSMNLSSSSIKDVLENNFCICIYFRKDATKYDLSSCLLSQRYI